MTIKTFKSKALDELWSKKKTSKIEAEKQERILRILDLLNVATVATDMNIAGYKFHSLTGFKPTRYSVHVNGPWCITFEFKDGAAYRVDYEQYH